MFKFEMHFSNLRAQRPLWVGWALRVGAKKGSLCGYLPPHLLFHLLPQLKTLVTQQLLGIEFLLKSVG